MSFHDYVNYISQKHCLAIAISVIKTKPDDLTIDQYINHLRNKINDDGQSNDLEDSICSDDFEVHDDKNYDIVDLTNEAVDKNIIDNIKTVERPESVTILKDYNVIETNKKDDTSGNSVAKVLKLFKDVNEITGSDKIKTNQLIINLTETYGEVNETINLNLLNDYMIMNDSAIDFTEINKIMESDDPSQSNNNTLVKIVRNNIDGEENNKIETKIQENIKRNTTQSSEVNTDFIQSALSKNNMKETVSNSNNNQEREGSKDLNKPVFNIENDLTQYSETVYLNSQAIDAYVPGYTQSYTHFSQSQDNIVIPQKYYKIRENISNVNNTIEIEELAMEIEAEATVFTQKDTTENNSNIISLNFYSTQESTLSANSNLNLTQNFHLSQSNPNIVDNFNTKPLHINETHANNIDNVTNNENTIKNTEDLENSQEIIEIDKDIVTSTQDIVPFKVIEEFNKVKSFLNRRIERFSEPCSSDSGYRSESQSKNTFKIGFQNSLGTLNQSAHCLLNYLMNCPLLASTMDITDEISKVLGDLIDRLHEEENCPSFIGEFMENVDVLTKRIFNGDNFDESVLLKKDEDLQRILLLNKSMHIQKYNIDKITNILENVHTELLAENIYEIEKIDEIENLCYIFHILEVLLKRYVVFKNSSQTQDSQEELKFPKRSTITDIWRKKWNTKYKDSDVDVAMNNYSNDLTKCADILNKIVIDCINGYSLVSFSALQCFNLIQS